MSFVGDMPDVSGFDVKLEAAQAKDPLLKTPNSRHSPTTP